MRSNRYIFKILKVQSWPDRHSKAAPAPKSSIGESANSESIIAILLDPCSEYSLIQNGILPYGADIRAELCLPSYTALDRLSYIIMIQYGTMRLTQAAAFMPADGFWISRGASIHCAPEASLQKNQSGRMGAGTASVPGGTRPENSADCQEQPAAL